MLKLFRKLFFSKSKAGADASGQKEDQSAIGDSTPFAETSVAVAEKSPTSAASPTTTDMALSDKAIRELNFNPVLLKVGKVENYLAPGAKLTGDIVLNDGGIRIQCEVEGSITQNSESLVIIDRDAVVTGKIRARYLIVLGEVRGNIQAERLVVGASGRIKGSILYQKTFGSKAGAKIHGQVTESETVLFDEIPAITNETDEPSSDKTADSRNNVVPFSPGTPTWDCLVDNSPASEKQRFSPM